MLDIFDDSEVVSDEDVGETEFLLEFMQKVQDLRLDRYIQGTDRLICQYDLRVEGKGSGDPDPLTLTTAEFMRVAILERSIETHSLHQLLYSVLDIVPAHLSIEHTPPLVDLKRLCDDRSHRHSRVEGCIGVLKDHLHVLSGFKRLFLWLR